MTYELLGDDAGAEQRYREAVRLAPNSPDARFRLAMLHWVRGEPARGDPGMSGFGAAQGWCQAFQWEVLNGRLERARELVQAQGEGASRCAPVLRALLYQQLGDAALARAVLDTAETAVRDSIAFGHDGPHPRLVLAQVYALRGDLDEANRWFAQAVERGYVHLRAARRLPTLAVLHGTPAFERSLRAMESNVLRERQQTEPGPARAEAAASPR